MDEQVSTTLEEEQEAPAQHREPTPKWKPIEPWATKKAIGTLATAISHLNGLHRQLTELSGIVGKPETERRTTFMVLVGGGFVPEADRMYREIGERNAWQFSKHTIQGVIDDLGAAYEHCKQFVPVKDLRITPEEHDRQQAERQERDARDRKRYEEREAARLRNWEAVKAVTPAGAKAAIIAVHDIDQSDMMSDYHGHKSDRHVLIGFRFTAKEDFRALRHAAAQYPETTHLGPDAPKEVEHRDNYSMGSGNYLKHGYRDSTGWMVRSWPLTLRGVLDYEGFEIAPHLSTPARPTEGTASVAYPKVSARRNLDKNGVELAFVAKPEPHVLAAIKDLGYKWSRFTSCWYIRYTPETWEAAKTFAASYGQPAPAAEPPQPPAAEPEPDMWAEEECDQMAELKQAGLDHRGMP